MASEIERKFLVTEQGWRAGAGPGRRLRQGYLSIDPERSVRVRLAGEQAWLTLKGGSRRYTRLEFEYPVPPEDATLMLEELCVEPLIDKTRYRVEFAGHCWDIDEFHGANAGLVVAEIELADEDEAFERPPWLGPEVTEDPRYLNVNLVRQPFRDWRED